MWRRACDLQIDYASRRRSNFFSWTFLREQKGAELLLVLYVFFQYVALVTRHLVRKYTKSRMGNMYQFIFSSTHLIIEGALSLRIVVSAFIVIVFCEVVLSLLLPALKCDN